MFQILYFFFLTQSTPKIESSRLHKPKETTHQILNEDLLIYLIISEKNYDILTNFNCWAGLWLDSIRVNQLLLIFLVAFISQPYILGHNQCYDWKNCDWWNQNSNRNWWEFDLLHHGHWTYIFGPMISVVNPKLCAWDGHAVKKKKKTNIFLLIKLKT